MKKKRAASMKRRTPQPRRSRGGMTRKAYNRFRACLGSYFPFPHRAGSCAWIRQRDKATGLVKGKIYCECLKPKKRLTAPF